MTTQRKPAWLRAPIPSGERWRSLSGLVARRGLKTVCDEARCPNKGECWGSGTATFMILGAVCTRGCRFCAVATAKSGEALRPEEPAELAAAMGELGLSYAVLTSVDRDDLPDRGAAHFASCVSAIRAARPGILVEVLIPDYVDAELDAVIASDPDVIAHNVETVPRLQRVRDARAGFERSLLTLSQASARSASLVKSSLILGLGEERAEILSVMDALLGAGCRSLVMGQYLRPTLDQLPVERYLPPEEFDELAAIAREKGFTAVVSAPFARTSYHARQGFAARRAAQEATE